jgi:hypothetical protein
MKSSLVIITTLTDTNAQPSFLSTMFCTSQFNKIMRMLQLVAVAPLANQLMNGHAVLSLVFEFGSGDRASTKIFTSAKQATLLYGDVVGRREEVVRPQAEESEAPPVSRVDPQRNPLHGCAVYKPSRYSTQTRR